MTTVTTPSSPRINRCLSRQGGGGESAYRAYGLTRAYPSARSLARRNGPHPAGVKVEMQVSDGLRPRDGTPANYGSAIFNPAAGTVSSASGRLKGRGIEQGPEGWQKLP